MEVNRKYETFEFKLDLKSPLSPASEAVVGFYGKEFVI